MTAKNLPKIWKKREKIRKKWEKIGKEEKSGRFFHFAPPDRAGYAADYIMCLYLQLAGLKQALPAGHSTHDP